LSESEQLESLIAYLAKSLVDRPEQVTLRLASSDGGFTFELQVAPEDVGKVIGRDGRTVNAMRTLLASAAQRLGYKARLEILDDRRSGAVPPASEEPGEPAGQ
jgi:predicted RNA-binding protein YlqC (UPF0109 family)